MFGGVTVLSKLAHRYDHRWQQTAARIGVVRLASIGAAWRDLALAKAHRWS
jgi:hypothetical protein